MALNYLILHEPYKIERGTGLLGAFNFQLRPVVAFQKGVQAAATLSDKQMGPEATRAFPYWFPDLPQAQSHPMFWLQTPPR